METEAGKNSSVVLQADSSRTLAASSVQIWKNSELGEPVWRLSARNQALENLGRNQYKSRVTAAGELGALLTKDKERTVFQHSKEGTHTVLYLLLFSWGHEASRIVLSFTLPQRAEFHRPVCSDSHTNLPRKPPNSYIWGVPQPGQEDQNHRPHTLHTFTHVLFILSSFPSSRSQPRSEASEQSSTRSPAAWPSTCSTR